MNSAFKVLFWTASIFLWAIPASATVSITHFYSPRTLNTGDSTSITATGSGNILVVCPIGYGGSTFASSVTDGGDTFTESDRTVTTTRIFSCWYALSVTAGRTAVVINFSGGGNEDAEIWEVHSTIAGSFTLDTHAQISNQTTSSTPIGASVTTTGAKDAVFAAIGQFSANVSSTLANGGDTFSCDGCGIGGGSSTFGWGSLINVTPAAHQPKWQMDTTGTFASVTISFIEPTASSVVRRRASVINQ